MANAVRRLQSLDREAHAPKAPPAEAPPPDSASASSEDESNPLAVLEAMGLEPTPRTRPQAPAPAQAPEAKVEPDPTPPVPEDEPPPASPPETAEPRAEEPDIEAPQVPANETEVGGGTDPVTEPKLLEPAPARAEVLDILASLAPIFRAAAVYPGPEGTNKQIEDTIKLLSQASVRLADQLGRDTDALEIDLRWRRSRASALAAELVAGHWLTAVIRQGGASFDGVALNEALPKLLNGVNAAVRVVREHPVHTAPGSSPMAAMFALTPLVIDLQHYADLIKVTLPDFEVEIEAAAAALGAVAGEEVLAGAQRLATVTPEALRDGLASELMAQVGQMALAAWQGVRGDVLGQLKVAPDTAKGLEVLSGPGMSGGVPVAAIADRLRAMVRHAVGATEYAIRVMLPKADA